MRLVSLAFAFALVPLVFVAAGCSGGKACVDLCLQAQAGACTSVHGSCSAFCGALDAVQGPAGCSSQRSEYQTCLSAGTDVCANDCVAPESALTSCVTTYCGPRLGTDANCATLAASF